MLCGMLWPSTLTVRLTGRDQLTAHSFPHTGSTLKQRNQTNHQHPPPHTAQVGFKRELIKEVKAFVVDAQYFRKDWEANGPMVPGLDPMEAVDRLRKFQQMFEVRKRKWENYSSGEELFGLPVTLYPELEQTEKEIQMLDRLYNLYVTVITTIKVGW